MIEVLQQSKVCRVCALARHVRRRTDFGRSWWQVPASPYRAKPIAHPKRPHHAHESPPTSFGVFKPVGHVLMSFATAADSDATVGALPADWLLWGRT